MKYKILKGTALFEKFIELQKKMEAAHWEARKLVSELGYSEWHEGLGVLSGGISGVCIPGEKPAGWANAFNPHEKGVYMPKKINANKLLLQRMSALPRVENIDLNSIIDYDRRRDCVQNRRISFRPGFNIKEEYALVEFSDLASKYKPLPDMTEITVSEYNTLNAK